MIAAPSAQNSPPKRPSTRPRSALRAKPPSAARRRRRPPVTATSITRSGGAVSAASPSCPTVRAATTRMRRPRPRRCGVTVQRQVDVLVLMEAGSGLYPLGLWRGGLDPKAAIGSPQPDRQGAGYQRLGTMRHAAPLHQQQDQAIDPVAADPHLRRSGNAHPHAARDGFDKRAVPGLTPGPLPWAVLAAAAGALDQFAIGHRRSSGCRRLVPVRPRRARRPVRQSRLGRQAAAGPGAMRQWWTWGPSPCCKGLCGNGAVGRCGGG